MRLYYATQAEAQTKAGAVHAWMVANDAAYAQSVEADQTLRWSIPEQDVDEAGNPVDSRWFIVTKPRCQGALTQAEKLAQVSK